MTFLIGGAMVLFCLGCAFYAEYQAVKARQAAARSGLGAVRASQAAVRAEAAAGLVPFPGEAER